MRLTENEIKMFEALRKSDLGKSLVEYIERLEGEICDVRNWTEKDSVESARQAARALKEMRKHLGTNVGTAKVIPDEFI